jgi:ABC-2 type transport system permease protein
MNNIFNIIKHEYLKILKSRGFQITTIIVVLLMLGGTIMMNVLGKDDEPSVHNNTIGYVDQSSRFIEDCSFYGFSFIRYENSELAQQAMINDQISRYLIFSQDYLSDGVVQSVSMYDTSIDNLLLSAIRNFITVNLVGQEIAPDILERLLSPYIFELTFVDENGLPVEIDNGNAVVFLLPYIFTLLLIVCIFTASGYLMQSLSEEKENRIMEVLLSSVSSKELLIGKIAGLGALGLTQVCIWIAAAAVVFNTIGKSTISELLSGVSITPDFAIIALIIFILGYLLFACLMGAFSVVGGSARESQQFAMFFTLPAVLPIILMSVIINHPYSLISRIATFFPLTSPGSIIMRYSIGEMPFWELAISIAILITSILLAAWFANKMFRTFLLMYGKTPKLGEIFKMIRQA